MLSYSTVNGRLRGASDRQRVNGEWNRGDLHLMTSSPREADWMSRGGREACLSVCLSPPESVLRRAQGTTTLIETGRDCVRDSASRTRYHQSTIDLPNQHLRPRFGYWTFETLRFAGAKSSHSSSSHDQPTCQPTNSSMAQPTQPYSFISKIVTIGDSGSGKSSVCPKPHRIPQHPR